MSLSTMKSPLYVRTAAEDLRERLQGASEDVLIDAVVQLYTLSRIGAIEADNHAQWLKEIMDAHYTEWHQPGPPVSCHPAHHQLVSNVIRPKWFKTVPIGGRILTAVWQALGAFNDDDAAERAALDALDTKDDSSEDDDDDDAEPHAQVVSESEDDNQAVDDNHAAATSTQDTLEGKKGEEDKADGVHDGEVGEGHYGDHQDEPEGGHGIQGNLGLGHGESSSSR